MHPKDSIGVLAFVSVLIRFLRRFTFGSITVNGRELAGCLSPCQARRVAEGRFLASLKPTKQGITAKTLHHLARPNPRPDTVIPGLPPFSFGPEFAGVTTSPA
jgi:hypothetical protein